MPIAPSRDRRDLDALRRHYETETELARRLKAAPREERRHIYSSMYEELFARVPDHPRLTRRDDPLWTEQANRSKRTLLRRFLKPDSVVGEFGAGDCRFAISLAREVSHVYAIDIADQAGGATDDVENLDLIVYDGYHLPLEDESLDLMFSDQLLEHLHPEDTPLHLETVRRVLRPGGIYVVRTPHRLTGPHDISRYFSDVAEGFHLKEWSCSELVSLAREVGFRRCSAYRTRGDRAFWMPLVWYSFAERLLDATPPRRRRRWSHLALKEVLVTLRK